MTGFFFLFPPADVHNLPQVLCLALFALPGFIRFIRFAWLYSLHSIENRLHYVRDVTMGEGASRVRERSGPQVMAACRTAAIGLLRTMGVTNIAEALRRNAPQVAEVFARLGIFKK